MAKTHSNNGQSRLYKFFNTKPKTSKLQKGIIDRTIVPSTYVDGKSEKDVTWDRDQFQNKVYV